MMMSMSVRESRLRYTRYINEHKRNVERAWAILRRHAGHLRFMRYGIEELASANIRTHDDSKYRPEEFEAYRKYYYPAEGETPCKEALDVAWNIHKEYNGHHWENWTTNDDLTMIERDAYFVEMVCDWLAMSMKFGGTTSSWITDNTEGVVLPGNYMNYLTTILDLVEPHLKGVGQYGKARAE